MVLIQIFLLPILIVSSGALLARRIWQAKKKTVSICTAIAVAFSYLLNRLSALWDNHFLSVLSFYLLIFCISFGGTYYLKAMHEHFNAK